ncbi:MAG: class I SAM-dependent methyltransferase [Rhodocyclaceae bacterium]
MALGSVLVPDGFHDLMPLDHSHNREVGGGLVPCRVAPQPALPSPWVQRFAPLIPSGGRVLDLACGMGRHARFLAERGHQVDAVDRDAAALECLRAVDGVHGVCVDLEANVWPFSGQSWQGIVVANYLHRPLFPAMIASLAPGGVLIYETFMVGNERFGRPSTPAFLLGPGELLDFCGESLSVIAFEQGQVSQPRPAVVQRICAVRDGDPSRITLPECVAPER